MHSTEVISTYLRASHDILRTLEPRQIEVAVDLLYEAWQRGKTVFTMGNGGSASTASHLASDLAKFTISPGKKRFKVVGLTDNVPLVSAWTNDSGFASIFAEQLEPWLGEGDVLVGISVHGGSGAGEAGAWSQNLLRAIALARERKAKTLALSGFSGGAMKEVADVCLVVPASSEPLGTALVESFHIYLHHLICLALKLRIAESK